jgi:hypothetical protein
MADEISLGKRTDNDIALDLLKVIIQSTGQADSADKILALYQKCRVAMHESIRGAR